MLKVNNKDTRMTPMAKNLFDKNIKGAFNWLQSRQQEGLISFHQLNLITFSLLFYATRWVDDRKEAD